MQAPQNRIYTIYLIKYNKFAYYTFCTPLKFEWDEESRKFVIKTYLPQKIICFVITAIHFYLILHVFHTRLDNLISESRNENSHPISYIRFLVTFSYMNCAVAVMYTQIFKGPEILSFLNDVNRFSKRYHPERIVGARRIVRKKKFT